MFVPLLLSFFGSLSFCFLSLLVKSILTGSLLGGVCVALGGIIMKAFLNLFRQLSEVNFRDSRFGNERNAVWLDTTDFGVFVFFSVNRFEVIGERDGCEKEDQKCERIHSYCLRTGVTPSSGIRTSGSSGVFKSAFTN